MDVSLVRVQPDGKTRELRIKKPVTVFGRQEGCQVRVPSGSVSRKHCELRVGEAGDITLVDLGSSNGTFVNQERVSEQPLAGGDLMSFGGFVFVVRVNGSPEEIDAEACFEDGLPEDASTSGGGVRRASPDTRTMAGGERRGEPERSGDGPSMPPLVGGDADDSSVVDFDFSLDEEDDEQPPL
ncbi:MAG: FHA domain-containing protein [Planctomycetota bacterium]